MNTKFILVVTILFLLHFRLSAGSVTIQDAQRVALNFYIVNAHDASPRVPLTVGLIYTAQEADGIADLYVFNINPAHGFVIVSATDIVTPVLAYSTETDFNSNFPEIGIKLWMNHAAGEIHGTILENMPASEAVNAQWRTYRNGERPGSLKSTVVNPMLSTQWNQFPWYNLFCPYDSADHAQSVTGCCATAMAQIMKYWNYPLHGTGTVTYEDSVIHGFNYNIGTISADLEATTYQWSQMPAQVTGSADDTAVALLMYQCGVSVNMDYGAYGSAAYFIGPHSVYSAFTKYFGYDVTSLQYQQMAYYDSAKWMPMIKKELGEGRPILYTGQDSGGLGGHAWVCDGYDANEMLHMNWGWGGMDNGYFMISNLNANPYNFTWSQAVLIGIQPPPSPTSINNVEAPSGYKLFPNPASSNFTITGNTGENPVEYTIYDILGNRIDSGLFTAYSNIIPVGHWSNGIYFIRLNDTGGESTIRFVVEK